MKVARIGCDDSRAASHRSSTDQARQLRPHPPPGQRHHPDQERDDHHHGQQHPRWPRDH